MKIPQSVREVSKKGPLAHLTTLNRDGSPQVTVVWVGIEGEEFVMGHWLCIRRSKTSDAIRELRCRCLVTRRTLKECGNTWWFTATRE
jgi:hypothetical protein